MNEPSIPTRITSKGARGMTNLKRWLAVLSILVLFSSVGISAVVHASPNNLIPTGWQLHTIDHQVTFAYPTNFVAANDGSPNVQIAGGALLDPTKMNYELLLGVEVNQTPNITVDQEATRLIQAYGQRQLVADRPSNLGRELVFHLANQTSYTVIISSLENGLREILINNEHSDPHFNSLIQSFLTTIHNS